MLKIIIFCYAFTLFFSCKEHVQVNDVLTINLSPDSFTKPEQINLSTIASHIEYIPLETNQDVILGRIHNGTPHFFDNKILLQNRGTLYLFDITGKFLNKIGDIGEGPGEHSKHFKFGVLSKDKLIVIYDIIKRKVFFHSYNGHFVSSFKIDFNPSSFIPYNNHLVFFNSQFRRKEADYHIISTLTKEGKIVKRYLHRPEESELDEKIRFLPGRDLIDEGVPENEFRFLDNVISSKEKIIWEISEDFPPTPKYQLNLGENQRPINDYLSENIVGLINNTFFKYNELHSYIETPHYMFFKMIWGGKKPPYAFVLYNKAENKRTWIQNKEEKRISHNFVNDLDGGVPFFPFWKAKENKLVLPISVLGLKEYLNTHKLKEQHIIDVNGRMALEQIVANAKDTDNPILMVVTLKD
ncbi:6-bladed beta-propeller [Formosa sp. 4Alg 33]|uniref:6-bladed beta-propeller n=1 Tax=Formosa sp. 4Alg 33 TaxID=3382189 RepID=UPI003D9C6429